MRFIKFPVVRFALFLILGIVMAYYTETVCWVFLLVFFIAVLGILWWFARGQIFQKIYFGLATYLCFFTIGMVNYQSHLPKFQQFHYSKFLTKHQQPIKLEVVETLKPDRYNHKFIAEVRSVSEQPTHGRILLYVPADSALNPPETGDRLAVLALPSEIPPPLNPYQFNYARYMKLQDVYHQIKPVNGHFKLLPEKNRNITIAFHHFRRDLLQKLAIYPFGKEEKSIIEALVLGHRETIDRDLYSAYATAGAIHILAVSGLHVGIVFFLLQMLLSPMQFIQKGRILKVILLIVMLWAYAALTGLSPSVTRAVTMFSFFGLAQLLNRPTNSINTLFLSMFFLLLWNPKWLFDVGFQLSYSAVFFILWLQPKMYRLYRPKYYLDKLFWTITTVSVAAQLGIAPLSIYYFNQFPGLFLLSNLVILPFLSVLVSMGLIVIALVSMDLLPLWLAQIYNEIIELLNVFVKWISARESFIFTDIHFSGYLLIGSYLVIIALAALWSKFDRRRIIFALTTVLILLCLKFMDRLETTRSAFIIFHKNRTTLIGVQQGDHLKVYRECGINSYRNEYPVKSFATTMNVSDYSEGQIPDVLSFNSQIIIVVDSSGVYPKSRDADIVLLRGSPKIHLDRLIDSLMPKIIIADASNYPSYVDRWRKTCASKKLPFHHTGDRGAFTLE